MRASRNLTLLAVTILLALTACKPATPAGGFSANSWLLTTLDGKPVGDGIVTAEVTGEGTVSGSAGCNQYTANYTTSGSSITFQPDIATTQMACPDYLMQLETAYLTALGQAASYLASNENTNLTLLDTQGKELATFTRLQPVILEGTNWMVTSYNNGNGAVISVLPNTTLTASFRADGSLLGFTGCNLYTNSFNTDGFQISINLVDQTHYQCPEALQLQEALFLSAYGMGGLYKVLGNDMEFRGSDGTLAMTFQQLGELSLVGPTWVLQSYNDQAAFVVPMEKTQIDLNFMEDGSVSGSSGCNQYSGSYQAGDISLSIGPLAATQKACSDPEGIMEQEAKYLAALESVASYEINVNALLLKDDSGTVILAYGASEP
jgi:heat shock protein HslJ